MSFSFNSPEELKAIYDRRFSADRSDYRQALWKVLVEEYFQALVPADATVLDLGCGYGEFSNHVKAKSRYAMDLNPRAPEWLDPSVKFLFQDCAAPWPIPDNSLDVIFTSNFFEHLPDKLALQRILKEARRCLKPDTGRLIALGPNIKYLSGEYWDFWDHFLCLTEMSLAEAMVTNGLSLERVVARFLPYTTINKPSYPMALVKLYLRLPMFWPLFGRQFLVVGSKRSGGSTAPFA